MTMTPDTYGQASAGLELEIEHADSEHPSAFNLPEPPPGIPASPLVPRQEISGFRLQ
jgi:hypothetical protein